MEYSRDFMTDNIQLEKGERERPMYREHKIHINEN